MKPGWLWDTNISVEEIRAILKDPQRDRFVNTAALLLSRNNAPKEVFEQYLDKDVFVQNWSRIKRQMRKDSWNDPRIIFWQAVHEKLVQEFKEQGIPIRAKSKGFVPDEVCRDIGHKIKNLRKTLGLTQEELAQRLGVSQQIISRIETGRENPSIRTLSTICQASGDQIVIDLRPSWMGGKIYSEQGR